MAIDAASPPERLLCGPGPANVDPAVQQALTRPLLGHMDPELAPILDEIRDMLARLYGLDGGMAIALQATGTAGMEAGIEALVEPGETVVIGIAGYFGMRLADIAGRAGAHVVEVRAEIGDPVSIDELTAAIEAQDTVRLVCLVLAETSIGLAQPLGGLGDAVHDAGGLLLVDCVTALGGMPIEVSAQGIDYAYSCSQKCLGAPPGLAPVALSDRALERIESRDSATPFTFDFQLLRDYWVKRPPAYHHTAPVLNLYALHEALRQVELEGADQRYARHRQAGGSFQSAMSDRGFDLLAHPEHRLPQLSAVLVPDGVDGKAVQGKLLSDHGIEVGGGLGPAFPAMWRVGVMGANARGEVVDRLVAAFDDVLD